MPRSSRSQTILMPIQGGRPETEQSNAGRRRNRSDDEDEDFHALEGLCSCLVSLAILIGICCAGYYGISYLMSANIRVKIQTSSDSFQNLIDQMRPKLKGNFDLDGIDKVMISKIMEQGRISKKLQSFS